MCLALDRELKWTMQGSTQKFEYLEQMIRPYAICLPDATAELIPLISFSKL